LETLPNESGVLSQTSREKSVEGWLWTTGWNLACGNLLPLWSSATCRLPETALWHYLETRSHLCRSMRGSYAVRLE